MRVWLGRSDAVELMGGLPDGVEADPWNGASPVPDSLDDVEFYAVPFLPRKAIVTEAISSISRLKVVQVPVAGYEDVLDVLPDTATLCNARGVHAPSTAEWVVGAIIAMVRDFPTAVRHQAAGVVQQRRNDTLSGKRILILGYGSIGSEVERKLAGFDVEIKRIARRERPGVSSYDAAPRLVPEADVVVVLVPGGDDTRHLIDRVFLASMKDGSLLVNAARGSVVDQDALANELRHARLRAALDVAEPDPLPPHHSVLGLPGLFYTPHQAGHTTRDIPMAYEFIGAQLRRYAAGEPLKNIVRSPTVRPLEV